MMAAGVEGTLPELGKYQMVMVRCQCGHRGPLRPSALPGTPKTFNKWKTPIWQLPRYLKCSVCGTKRASVRVMTR